MSFYKVLGIIIPIIAVLHHFKFPQFYSNNLFKDKSWLTTKCPYLQKSDFKSNSPLEWKKENVPKRFSVVSLEAVFRHGTRYPSPELRKDWVSLLQKTLLRSPLLKKTYENLGRDFPPELSYTLHEKGVNEMKYLADKVYSMFPTIHRNPSFKIDNLKVFTSYKTRCRQSAFAFTKQFIEVINKDNKDAKVPLIDIRDLHLKESESLRIFDHCNRYDRLVLKNKDAFIENQNFQSSLYFDILKKDLFDILDVSFTSREVINLYKLCTFKYALTDDFSVCDLFKQSQLKILGYDGDMKHFYKTGFGHRINSEMFCSFLLKILKRLEEIVDKNGLHSKSPSLVLQFGHAETVIPLITLLGLFKDHPLRADNYEYLKEYRVWKTSAFSPFSTNLMFALYVDEDKNFFISTVINGYMMKFPRLNCTFCPFKVFKNFVVERLSNLENSLPCTDICF